MYREMYVMLFDAVTKSMESLAEGDAVSARWILEDAQRETESLFMDWDWEREEESGG